MILFTLDIRIDIQPMIVRAFLGDATQLSCHFTGEYRVQRDQLSWLKGANMSFVDSFRCHRFYAVD
jgi:hypothetical protein